MKSRHVLRCLAVVSLIPFIFPSRVVAEQESSSVRSPKDSQSHQANPVGGWYGTTEKYNVYMTFDPRAEVTIGVFTRENKSIGFMGGNSIRYTTSDAGKIELSVPAMKSVGMDHLGAATFNKDGTLHLDIYDICWVSDKSTFRPIPIEERPRIKSDMRKVCDFAPGLIPGPDMLSVTTSKAEPVAGTTGRKAAASDESQPAHWPSYDEELVGQMEVRVKNPNDFKVRVGLRSGGRGKDFTVVANGIESVRIPNGRYDIYFQYSTDPEGIYQGDSFTISNNGVEIQIVKVVGGNYGIRKVK